MSCSYLKSHQCMGGGLEKLRADVITVAAEMRNIPVKELMGHNDQSSRTLP